VCSVLSICGDQNQGIYFDQAIPANPYQITGSDGKTYTLTICSTLSSTLQSSYCPANAICTPKASACQTFTGAPSFCLGQEGTEQWTRLTEKEITVNFTGGDPTISSGDRNWGIHVICTDTANTPSFSGEGPTGHYNFVWNHPCACKDACKGAPPPPSGGGGGGGGGLSGGSIFLIIVLCLFVVYCVAGVLFMKFKREASGTDLIPNKDFWFSLPGLCKDGVLFVWCKITGKEMAQYREV